MNLISTYVLFGDSRQPNVAPLNMEEGSASDVCDRRPDLLSGMDDVDSEGIDCIPADIIAIHPRD